MSIKTYRDLIAWQKAMHLAREVYSATATLPDEEKFGLTAQMRRAAIPVPSNIAEGYGRQRRLEHTRFLRLARGSLMELESQLTLAESGPGGSPRDSPLDRTASVRWPLTG